MKIRENSRTTLNFQLKSYLCTAYFFNMATTKNTDTKAERKKKKPANNETTKKVFGIVLIIFSLFLLFSFISYLLTRGWESDFTVINKAKQALFSFLFDENIKSGNTMGKLGLLMSYMFIREIKCQYISVCLGFFVGFYIYL